MVVQCPGCDTKYNVPVENMGKGPTQLRCSRCGKTFALKPSEPDEQIDESGVTDDAEDESATEASSSGKHAETVQQSDQDSAADAVENEEREETKDDEEEPETAAKAEESTEKEKSESASEDEEDSVEPDEDETAASKEKEKSAEPEETATPEGGDGGDGDEGDEGDADEGDEGGEDAQSDESDSEEEELLKASVGTEIKEIIEAKESHSLKVESKSTKRRVQDTNHGWKPRPTAIDDIEGPADVSDADESPPPEAVDESDGDEEVERASTEDLVARASRAADDAVRAAEEAKKASSAEEARRLADEAAKAAALAQEAARAARELRDLDEEPKTVKKAVSETESEQDFDKLEPPASEQTAELNESDLETLETDDIEEEAVKTPPSASAKPPPTPQQKASAASTPPTAVSPSPPAAKDAGVVPPVPEPSPDAPPSPDFSIDIDDDALSASSMLSSSAPLSGDSDLGADDLAAERQSNNFYRNIGIAMVALLGIAGLVFVYLNFMQGESEGGVEGVEAVNVDFVEAELEGGVRVVMIRGRIVNNTVGARKNVTAKAQILDSGGVPVAERQAPCGSTWTEVDLTRMTPASLAAEYQSLDESDREVSPNSATGIGCSVVFDRIPPGFSRATFRPNLIVIQADPVRYQNP